MDFYKNYGNLEQEASQQNFEIAKKLSIELHETTLTLEQIINHIQKDRTIIILLNWNVLKEKEGYQGHFVPVVGYDKENIYVHNHGFLSPQAFMPIKKDVFEKARKSKGTDEDIVVVYRK